MYTFAVILVCFLFLQFHDAAVEYTLLCQCCLFILSSLSLLSSSFHFYSLARISSSSNFSSLNFECFGYSKIQTQRMKWREAREKKTVQLDKFIVNDICRLNFMFVDVCVRCVPCLNVNKIVCPWLKKSRKLITERALSMLFCLSSSLSFYFFRVALFFQFESISVVWYYRGNNNIGDNDWGHRLNWN